MVSLWPWRGDDSSPASFEKALSSLATKLTKTQAQLDKTRSTSRRIRVLWTLYLSFAYLVYAIVLVLVVGWKKLGTWDWTGLAGGPVAIFLTRTILTTYFSFRIDSLSAKLKDQQDERAATIRKLKAATKYDSTQQLLEKYGGAEANKTKAEAKEGDARTDDGKGQAGAHRHGHLGTPRTNMAPPPTANIPKSDSRGSIPSHPGTPQSIRMASTHNSPQVPRPAVHDTEPAAEFAPNAFGLGGAPPPLSSLGEAHHYAPAYQGPQEGHWYDRIMDLLLGEDETAPKNRIVLICSKCRLVNGRAPPGTSALSEIGTWKCMGCGASNGEMDEGKKILQEVLEDKSRHDKDSAESVLGGLSEGQVDDDDVGSTEEQTRSEERSGLKKRKSRAQK